MKKLVIIKPGCKEFANELMCYMSIAACGLETGVTVKNPSRLLHKPWMRNVAGRALYALYARAVMHMHPAGRLDAWRAPIFLPPTKALPEQAAAQKALYLFGWVFRNPIGLEKYRAQLLKIFAPGPRIAKKVAQALAPHSGKTIIGVEMRTRPYPGFDDGEFLVSCARTREVVNEYLKEHGLSAKDVSLVIASDGPVSHFENLPAHIERDPKAGLYLLSRASVVIGTNSTRANLPAWIGNVAHIVATNDSLDWGYYKDKHNYFDNKYLTLVHQ